MSDHRAPGASRRWWRALGSVPARLLMTAGIFVGFGAVGTSAYWTDQATVQTGSFASGTFDLQLGPDTGTYLLEGQGGTWTFAVLELADVAPGESVAKNIVIKNGGSTTLRFDGTARSTTNDLSPHLKVSTVPNANAGNTGAKDTVTRAGSCTGGTASWWTDEVMSTTSTAIVKNQTPAYVTLLPGAHLQVCMLVKLDAATPTTYQGKTTTITATFSAVQPNA